MPYYNTGPFTIQTLSIILFNTVIVTSVVILRPSSQFYQYFFSSTRRDASKKYNLTDSCAPKCLPRVTKTVMYIVNTYRFRYLQFLQCIIFQTTIVFGLANAIWSAGVYGDAKAKLEEKKTELNDIESRLTSLEATLVALETAAAAAGSGVVDLCKFVS
jgi:hypothetical protein